MHVKLYTPLQLKEFTVLSSRFAAIATLHSFTFFVRTETERIRDVFICAHLCS